MWSKGVSAPNGDVLVPEMVTPAMRTTAVLLSFLNLTKMTPAMQICWFFELDKYVIKLHRARKNGDT